MLIESPLTQPSSFGIGIYTSVRFFSLRENRRQDSRRVRRSRSKRSDRECRHNAGMREYKSLNLFSSPQSNVSGLSCPEPCGRSLCGQIRSQRICPAGEGKTIYNSLYLIYKKLWRYLCSLRRGLIYCTLDFLALNPH
jgi:hypothetical protein